jgi:hypothetical protein
MRDYPVLVVILILVALLSAGLLLANFANTYPFGSAPKISTSKAGGNLSEESKAATQVALATQNQADHLIKQYLGERPPSALLRIGKQIQEAGYGSITWPKDYHNGVLAIITRDAIGPSTSDQPLVVNAPFTATLQLPVHIPPTRLWYWLQPGSKEHHRPDNHTIIWEYQRRPQHSLTLKQEQDIVFIVEPGDYVLVVDAEWQGLGSVDYGFFIRVADERMSQTEQIKPVQATAVSNPIHNHFALYLLEQPLDEEQMSGLGFARMVQDKTPLLSLEDLVAYHLASHEFELTPEAFERIASLQAPVDGLPFVVSVGRTPIYQGAFWPMYSSLSFDGIAIWLPPQKENNLRVELGYPGSDFFSGPDKRSHSLLISALHDAGLVDWAEWLQPTEARSGVLELDEIIEALLARDRETLRGLARYTTIACTTQDGLGGPPKCKPGQAEGTLVQVLPVQSGEGDYLYLEGIDYTLDTLVNISGLVAAYRLADEAPTEPWQPTEEYALVFLQHTGEYPHVLTLYVKAGKIVRLGDAPGETLANLAQQAVGEWLLPVLAKQE